MITHHRLYDSRRFSAFGVFRSSYAGADLRLTVSPSVSIPVSLCLKHGAFYRTFAVHDIRSIRKTFTLNRTGPEPGRRRRRCCRYLPPFLAGLACCSISAVAVIVVAGYSTDPSAVGGSSSWVSSLVRRHFEIHQCCRRAAGLLHLMSPRARRARTQPAAMICCSRCRFRSPMSPRPSHASLGHIWNHRRS